MSETVIDKYQYERLISDANKTEEGWYSPEDGFVDFESIKQYSKIQSDLANYGIAVTLKEGEYCYSSFCTETRCASWITYPTSSEEEFIEFAKDYFK